MTASQSGTTDLELLESAQSGDRERFAMLYGRYWPRAVRMATVMCNSKQTAKDVVRVSFAEAWRTCGDYRAESGSVHSWLFGIVREQAVFLSEGGDLWGRSRYRPGGRLRETDESMNEHDDVGSDAVNAIALLLADAPEEQRELVALAFFGELSPKEISGILNLTEEAVVGRMRFGLEDLRARDYAPHA